MSQILILPLDKADMGNLQILSVGLEQVMQCEVSIDKQSVATKDASLPGRNQIHSTAVLAKLDQKYSAYQGKVIGVTEQDLAIPILTFVFGEAQLDGRAAVISTFRLNPDYYGMPEDDALFEQRILCEALHELGHTFGLKHCPDWECVMHTANDVGEVDVRGKGYCSSCKSIVEKGISLSRDSSCSKKNHLGI